LSKHGSAKVDEVDRQARVGTFDSGEIQFEASQSEAFTEVKFEQVKEQG